LQRAWQLGKVRARELKQLRGYRMSRILTVASQKGGVGKTTTAVNLAASLSLAGKQVLLLDFDPQGNASSGVGSPKATLSPSGRQPGKGQGLLSAGANNLALTPFLQATRIDNLRLLPASSEYSRLELIQEVQERALPSFRDRLREAGKGCDYILIDCPPSLGGLPTIALSVSDAVLIPVQCEYYAMEGLSQILPLVNKLKATTNPSLEVEGLLLTMFSEDLDLSVEVMNEVSDFFRETVFQTIIPRDVVLAEAASHGLPALEYAPLSRGAWSYVELAREVLEHDRS
jgi:chromosome partitioning protein